MDMILYIGLLKCVSSDSFELYPKIVNIIPVLHTESRNCNLQQQFTDQTFRVMEAQSSYQVILTTQPGKKSACIPINQHNNLEL